MSRLLRKSGLMLEGRPIEHMSGSDATNRKLATEIADDSCLAVTSGSKDESARARTLHTNLRRTILLAALYSFAPCLAINCVVLNGPKNPDLWWHLRAGAWIVQHHGLPGVDPFSALGKPWVAYNWLFEVTLYGFYRSLGLVGAGLYVVLIVGGIGLALYRAIRSRMGGFAAPGALAAVALFLMARLYSVRPWLFSILFFVAEIDILFAEVVGDREAKESKRLWLLPAIFMLWANLHIQFTYGLAVLVLCAITHGVEVIRDTGHIRLVAKWGRESRRLWLVTALSFLATFVNPYGWRLYVPVVQIAHDRMPLRLVQELRAPDFRSAFDYILILVVLVGAFVLGRVQLKGRLFAGLLLASSTLVSLQMVRDEWFALIVALLILASAYGKEIAAPSPSDLPRRNQVVAAGLAVVFIFVWAHRQNLTNSRLEEDVASTMPVRAADFVARHGFPGPLYNYFDYGGYLMWHLPELPVSMDGRTNIYGDERLARSMATWNCTPGWKDDADLRSANLVIGPVYTPLASALQDDKRFQLAYEDKTAVVFVKRSPKLIPRPLGRSGSSRP